MFYILNIKDYTTSNFLRLVVKTTNSKNLDNCEVNGINCKNAKIKPKIVALSNNISRRKKNLLFIKLHYFRFPAKYKSKEFTITCTTKELCCLFSTLGFFIELLILFYHRQKLLTVELNKL